MEKILFIYSSPTMGSKKGSISSLMAEHFKKFYIESHPKCEIIEMNLNKEPMAQKTLTADNFSTGFFNESDSEHYIEQLRSVNKVVLAAPMTNFNYSAVLKNYLDHILVAGKSFIYKYDRNGESEGLLKHLHVQLLTTQGADFGWYKWGNHTLALTGTFEFIGAHVGEPITIFGTKTPTKINLPVEEVVAPFLSELKAKAQAF